MSRIVIFLRSARELTAMMKYLSPVLLPSRLLVVGAQDSPVPSTMSPC